MIYKAFTRACMDSYSGVALNNHIIGAMDEAARKEVGLVVALCRAMAQIYAAGGPAAINKAQNRRTRYDIATELVRAHT